MIDGNNLSDVIRGHVETLCRHFFPAGVKQDREWKIGDITGAEGNSLGISLVSAKAGLWRDRATDQGGNFTQLLMASRNLQFQDATNEISRCLGIDLENHENGKHPPLDWASSQKPTKDQEERMAAWRGYSLAFVHWLVENNLLRVHASDSEARWVFPIHKDAKIAGTHSRPIEWRGTNRCQWKIFPSNKNGGPGVQPLVIGNLSDADQIFLFESTWDMLAVCDKLSVHETDGVTAFCTRGTGNSKLAAAIPPKASRICIWQQNDDPGRQWVKEIAEVLPKTLLQTTVLVPDKFVDVNDWTRAGATAADLLRALEGNPRKPKIIVRSPSEIIAYQPPPGIVLVGDNHITRGSVFVIGGAPGVGKSRASVALAGAGANKCDWFGLPVHVHFRTLIVQNENGRFRLKKDFSELDTNLLDKFVRVSEPPPFGLTFDDLEFREDLSAIIREFGPDLLIIDPWNAAARDEKARNYQDTFNLIRQVIPAGDDGPAIGIVAHTRKPQGDERVSGRALLNLLAGSYVLGSVPRTVFVMQAASDDVADDRIVWTCCKNNDGELGNRSAWRRSNGFFERLSEFDWNAWNKDGKSAQITFEIVPQIIVKSGGKISQSILIKKLIEKGVKESTAYRYKDKALEHGLIKSDKGTGEFTVV